MELQPLQFLLMALTELIHNLLVCHLKLAVAGELQLETDRLTDQMVVRAVADIET